MDGVRTVDDIFTDFVGRRAGIIKALTTDVEDFFRQCDPEKDNVSLYGHPNEQWEVTLPSEEVPPELPEPALGINFARDGMPDKDWLYLVAVHSDSWLLSVAFYFGARFGFDKTDRKHLFNNINELPTLFEIVSAAAKKLIEEKTTVSNHSSGNKSKSNPELRVEDEKYGAGGDLEEKAEHEGETLCGWCGSDYGPDKFWILCDICEKWFHGKCVKITPARAKQIKYYKCPSCTTNRRPGLS